MFTYHRSKPRKQTRISKYVDEYYLSKDNKLLKKDIQRDQHEFIQAQEYTNVDEIHDKLLDMTIYEGFYNNESDVVHEERERELSKLDILLEADRLVEQYAAENGIDNPTAAKVKKHLDAKVKMHNEKITELKERQNNEKVHPKQESKQEELLPNG